MSGDGVEFTDLVHSYVKIKLRVKMTPDVKNYTSVINYIGATLFNKIDVLLNDTQISSSYSNNAYRAILEILLTYDEAAIQSQLQLGGFYKDTAGKMDAFLKTDDADVINEGLVHRHALTGNGQIVEFFARIHADIFNQPKLLVNGVRMRLKFHKNKADFCLLGSDDATLSVEDMTLVVRKCQLTSLAYNQIINKSAIYPITRVLLKEYTRAPGVSSININNVASGILPQRIVLCMVTNSTASGERHKNPFNFQNNDLRTCNISINGSTINGEMMRFNFKTDEYMDGYLSLFNSTGKLFHNVGSLISRGDYKNGYTIISADLSPSLCDGAYIDPDSAGDLSIALTFGTALTESISIIIYCEYNSTIEITKTKQVIPFFKV